MDKAENAVNQNGITQEEFDLIQQLVQKGLERNAPIEYEQIEGYEVPPRTQFSMLNKPALSIKYGQMTFNMACIKLFEGIRYILPLINAEKKKLMILLLHSLIIWLFLKIYPARSEDASSLLMRLLMMLPEIFVP